MEEKGPENNVVHIIKYEINLNDRKNEGRTISQLKYTMEWENSKRFFYKQDLSASPPLAAQNMITILKSL